MLKHIIGIIFFLISLAAWAGPPFLTDDPEPLDYHHWDATLFTILDKNSSFNLEPDLSAPAIELNYGAFPNTQLHLIVPYAWSLPSAAPAENGIGDVEAGVKYRFIEEADIWPQIAIFPAIEIPIGDANQDLGNGKAWYKLPLWLEKNWGDWTTFAGGGYAINPAKGMLNYFFGGWSLQKKITEQLTLGGEIFTQGTASNDSRPFTVFNAGGSYDFSKQFSLLFTAGNTIFGQQHMVAYLGLYWTGP